MRNLNKLILLISLVGISLLGCNKTKEQSKISTEDTNRSFRIAYIARTQGDSFAAWLLDSVKSITEEQYSDVKVDFFNGQNKNEVINSLIENAIVNKYDAILIQANDQFAHLKPLNEALSAGIVVVAVNTIVDPETFPNVDASPYEQGAVNARYALDIIPQNANLVVLLGPSGNRHTKERYKAWSEEFFAKRPDVKTLDTQIANWNKEEGLRFMEDWIQAYGNDIDAIVSMNDNMALGALEAYKGVDLDLPLVFGVDGTAEAALAISEGKMTSTSLQSAYDLAKYSLQMVHDYLTGKKSEVEFVAVPNPLYTIDNVEELLEIHKARGVIK